MAGSAWHTGHRISEQSGVYQELPLSRASFFLIGGTIDFASNIVIPVDTTRKFTDNNIIPFRKIIIIKIGHIDACLTFRFDPRICISNCCFSVQFLL